MSAREYKNWIGDHMQANDQAALEKACDAYSDLQERHGLPRLSEGENCAFEAGWEAAMEFVKQSTT